MTGYLIDTDWIIDSLHGELHATQALLDLASDGLAVSVMTYGELVQGAYFGTDPDGALRALRRFLRGKRLLPVTRPIAERFGHIRGSLRQRGLIVGDADLLIAATAIHHDRILVTRNVRHFSRIPNLSLYRPTT